MTETIAFAEKLVRLRSTFSVSPENDLVVSARLNVKYLAAKPTRIKFADALQWRVKQMIIDDRRIAFDPCYTRGDHFSDALHNGFIKLGVIQATDLVSIVVTPTMDDLLFSAWLSGYCVQHTAGINHVTAGVS